MQWLALITLYSKMHSVLGLTWDFLPDEFYRVCLPSITFKTLGHLSSLPDPSKCFLYCGFQRFIQVHILTKNLHTVIEPWFSPLFESFFSSLTARSFTRLSGKSPHCLSDDSFSLHPFGLLWLFTTHPSGAHILTIHGANFRFGVLKTCPSVRVEITGWWKLTFSFAKTFSDTFQAFSTCASTLLFSYVNMECLGLISSLTIRCWTLLRQTF